MFVCLVDCLPIPTQLHMTHYSNTCLLLEWTSEVATPTSEATPTILGYRVYVNGIAEGQVQFIYLTCHLYFMALQVGPNKRRAYLEGLDPSATYR